VSRFRERINTRGAASAAPRLLLVLLAAGVVAAPARAQGTEAGPLCGIVRPVDELLHCPEPSPPAERAAPASTPPASVQGQAQAQAVSLQQEPPRRIATAPRYVPDLLLVRFRRGTSARQRADVLQRAGVSVERKIADLGVFVVRMPPEHRDAALATLRSSHLVANAERDAVFEQLDTTPNDTDWSAQWGLRLAGLQSAWDFTRGSNVVVAVLDTGVDARHPDLQGAILPGFNVVDPAAGPVDDNGHGTAVAGIIAARTNNRAGIAGICWTCSILPVKVLGADGTGDTAQVAAGIVRAADAHARVISMSLGGPADDQALEQAVSYAAGKGAILVAAAGNNGASTPFYPAASPNVISVAATDESDRLYSWSNFGSWVQVAAPGCNAAPGLSGNYVMFCGTSSATPFVSGLVALLLSKEPGADRSAIVSALEGSTVAIGGRVGRGRVDAVGALASLGSAAGSATTPILTVSGLLTPGTFSRVYRRSLPGGRIGATLSFGGAARLTFSIRNAAGAVVARASGTSPLRLSAPLPAGRFAFAVSGARTRAAFRLVLTNTALTASAGSWKAGQ
jgi:subtilisin family serine protease